MESKLYNKSIKIAALFALSMLVFTMCRAQTIRISTAQGLVIASESNNPDEICIAFGVMSGEVSVKHLGKSGSDLKKRLGCAVRMADDAGVDYSNFLRENSLKDSTSICEYYDKCCEIREQFFSLMPEVVLLEIRQATQNFQ